MRSSRATSAPGVTIGRLKCRSCTSQRGSPSLRTSVTCLAIVDAHVAVHHRSADRHVLVQFEAQQAEEVDGGSNVGHGYRGMIEVLQHGSERPPWSRVAIAMLIQVVHCHPLTDSFDHSLFLAIVEALRGNGHE